MLFCQSVLYVGFGQRSKPSGLTLDVLYTTRDN
nr:MAG TPA: hypothetical protein [Caudoviricetes sp.]DAY62674.1 MAG TPA: hypothetical protein [Caudoviricetes sp.]